MQAALDDAEVAREVLPRALERCSEEQLTQLELQSAVAEAISTCSIEGINLDPAAVRSLVAWRLGAPGGGPPVERHVEGVVAMVLDARRGTTTLTAERLHGWQAALFPFDAEGIAVGRWRSGDVQVVSDRVHFQGPPAERLEAEMAAFIDWFDGQGREMPPLLQASMAHLWFVTIHPFDDGNGRAARAIGDLAAARGGTSAH